MKILQINKNHRYLGGTEKYYFEISELLKKNGHLIAHFSMKHPRNRPSDWEKYFVSEVSFRDVSLINGWRILGRMIYSLEARRKMDNLLDVFKPEVVHIHNIYYHISPSILPEIKKRNIPIVYTVHDYHLLTPNITFFHNGRICELTKNNFYKVVLHRCVNDSYFASFLAAATLQIHKKIKIYEKNVDYFITPSLFMRNKMIEYGFDSKKIIHSENFINLSRSNKKNIQPGKKYILYFGRIFEHKGLQFLIEVAKKLPNINFKIAGSGSYEPSFRNQVKKYNLKNIFFLGFLSPIKLQGVISKSRFTIVPSLWYENMPYAILEAFALSKPVVASNIGGIPEIVKDRKNGILFEPGNLEECVKAIMLLWDDHQLVKKMGNCARKTVEERYNPDKHYEELMLIYKKAIRKNFSKK